MWSCLKWQGHILVVWIALNWTRRQVVSPRVEPRVTSGQGAFERRIEVRAASNGGIEAYILVSNCAASTSDGDSGGEGYAWDA